MCPLDENHVVAGSFFGSSSSFSLSSDDPYLFLRYNSPFVGFDLLRSVNQLERDPLFRWWILWGLPGFSYSWPSPPLTGLWAQAHHGVNCSSAPSLSSSRAATGAIIMSNSGLED
ncbi:hypothetical protein ACMYSQ_001044 [Aspergillus niger]